jgi:hypothetical protein
LIQNKVNQAPAAGCDHLQLLLNQTAFFLPALKIMLDRQKKYLACAPHNQVAQKVKYQ